MMSPVLQVAKLGIDDAAGNPVLAGISFCLDADEVFAVVGCSGAPGWGRIRHRNWCQCSGLSNCYFGLCQKRLKH
ncbi:hypothetical protein [Candidatus Symbiopectobacterium endolongispinus]|uniref:hypothetical protein n=1 Tax=Candidatus Symbiopectobacterium endolongispinus TaxID=2812664 RepID=UPI00207A1BEB|nr:hypothetical protein [Candidatus Symbiopectobacterium endolongispinus]MBT9429458.1 hypothetical protein [Candidatus Symbiopectobacterium endolongispinus]